jgi:3-deoxy-D-manno-octulosonate 8-phosphate phosphatase KdsC-like HAD superfamily phosphatase
MITNNDYTKTLLRRENKNLRARIKGLEKQARGYGELLGSANTDVENLHNWGKDLVELLREVCEMLPVRMWPEQAKKILTEVKAKYEKSPAHGGKGVSEMEDMIQIKIAVEGLRKPWMSLIWRHTSKMP